MSCGCGQHAVGRGEVDKPLRIKPDAECVFCGYKHFCAARAFWREGLASGYTTENRADICGELTAAQWHLWRKDYALAQMIRDIRHLVEHGREAEVDWSPALSAIDTLRLRELSADTPPPSPPSYSPL